MREMSPAAVDEGLIVAFRQLKPICVQASKQILAFKKQQCEGTQIVETLSSLRKTLDSIDELDPKLSDYVFFPLSGVFRENQRLPHSAIALALKCLHLLVLRGWNQAIQPGLCKEILILLSFLIGNKSHSGKGPFTDEVQIAAIECCGSIFSTLNAAVIEFYTTTPDEATAIIGNATSSIIDNLKVSESSETQIVAATALASIGRSLSAVRIFETFLPGMISALSQIIEGSKNSRRSYRSIVSSIDCLRELFELLKKNDTDHGASGTNNTAEGSETDQNPWIKSNASHLNAALVKIVKSKSHDRDEVHQALFDLLAMLVREFEEVLPESMNMVLEVLVGLSSGEQLNGTRNRRTDLEHILRAHPLLSTRLGTLMHSWILKIPRILQMQDDQQHELHFALLSTAYSLCKQLDHDTTFLTSSLVAQLVDGAAIVVDTFPSHHAISDIDTGIMAAGNSSSLLLPSNGTMPFTQLSTRWSRPLACCETFLRALVSGGVIESVTQDLVQVLSTSSDRRFLPCLWLLATAYRLQSNDSGDDIPFINTKFALERNHPGPSIDELERVYAMSLDVLSTSTHMSTDWRKEALCLEIVGMYAVESGKSFEAELMDTLFPIVERMGSSQPELRTCAATCLQDMARACGVKSSTAMLVQNADYLVNSIALKFNSFDISFQSPRVLAIIIELCGPSITPYLDDIVDSIVSALGSYHGYPAIVDSLFGVVECIIQQGTTPGDVKEPARRKSKLQIATHANIRDIPGQIRRIASEDPHGDRHGIPQENTDRDNKSEVETEDQLEAVSEGGTESTSGRVDMLHRSIVRLVQYHLTNESPAIRQRLLDLAAKSCHNLSRNEEEFLPLVNDIWPVITRRLYDSDKNVQIAAISTVQALLQGAGDFLTTRIHDEWKGITSLITSTMMSTKDNKIQRPGKRLFTLAGRMWDALLSMLETLLEYIPLTGSQEDEVFVLLFPFSTTRPSLYKTMQKINSDALWLLKCTDRTHGPTPEQLETPTLEGFRFAVVNPG